jgi:hypothetical protein
MASGLPICTSGGHCRRPAQEELGSKQIHSAWLNDRLEGGISLSEVSIVVVAMVIVAGTWLVAKIARIGDFGDEVG